MSNNALARPQERTQIKITEVSQELKKKAAFLALMLPDTMTPERMRGLVLTSFQKNPKLLECSTSSILQCVYEAAKAGLEPDTGTQECHIIPRRNKGQMEATFLIGFRGAMILAKRGGGGAQQIWSQAIRVNDEWEAPEGSSMTLVHKVPRIEGVPMRDKERGKIIAAYACARFKDGFVQTEIIYQDDIDIAKKTAHIYAGSPWNHHESAMWRKTAVKRLTKYLTTSPEIARIVQLDDMADAGISQKMGEQWDHAQDDPEIIDVESHSQPEGQS